MQSPTPTTSSLSPAVTHHVAHGVASAWKRRGVVSYPYEDLYQDAVEVMHKAIRRYNPERGSLEAFLHSCCVRQLSDRITRAIQPASARSNNDVVNLRNLKTVQVNSTQPDDTDYDHIVWLTQLRERLIELVGDDMQALGVALGHLNVRDIATGPDNARVLHQRVRRVKRRILNDKKIYQMLKEAR